LDARLTPFFALFSCRSLIALSLIMSLLQFKPAPMYILDEIDAALDLSHTQHIGQLFRNRFKGSQFIVVSLKEGLFTNANVLFKAKVRLGRMSCSPSLAVAYQLFAPSPLSSLMAPRPSSGPSRGRPTPCTPVASRSQPPDGQPPAPATRGMSRPRARVARPRRRRRPIGQQPRTMWQTMARAST
jgi:hypothetical protein